jgi:hypothetical protein
VGSLIQFGGSPDPLLVEGIILSVIACLGNFVALLVSANARTLARTRLREFDAEQFPGH